jgi:hypothetical protein
MITDNTAGYDATKHVKENSEFLMVGNVSRDKIALLLRKVNPTFSLAGSKRGMVVMI